MSPTGDFSKRESHSKRGRVGNYPDITWLWIMITIIHSYLSIYNPYYFYGEVYEICIIDIFYRSI